MEYMDKNNLKGIVLAGRPYHVDPEAENRELLLNKVRLEAALEDALLAKPDSKK